MLEWKGPRYRCPFAFRRPLARDLRRAVIHRAHLFFYVLLSREFYTCTAVSVTPIVASHGGSLPRMGLVSLSTSFHAREEVLRQNSIHRGLAIGRSFILRFQPVARSLSTDVGLVGGSYYANLTTRIRGEIVSRRESVLFYYEWKHQETSSPTSFRGICRFSCFQIFYKGISRCVQLVLFLGRTRISSFGEVLPRNDLFAQTNQREIELREIVRAIIFQIFQVQATTVPGKSSTSKVRFFGAAKFHTRNDEIGN